PAGHGADRREPRLRSNTPLRRPDPPADAGRDPRARRHQMVGGHEPGMGRDMRPSHGGSGRRPRAHRDSGRGRRQPSRGQITTSPIDPSPSILIGSPAASDSYSAFKSASGSLSPPSVNSRNRSNSGPRGISTSDRPKSAV